MIMPFLQDLITKTNLIFQVEHESRPSVTPMTGMAGALLQALNSRQKAIQRSGKFQFINIPTQSVASPRTPHLSMIYVHCDLDLWPLTSKINRVHPLIMVNLSAKFDKKICNGSVSIVFTRSSDGRNHARTDARNHSSVTISPPQRVARG